MERKSSNILIEPLITEKSTALSQQSKYTFKVSDSATKTNIKRAFSEIFPDRKVVCVQTSRVRGHKRRTRFGYNQPKDWKKAVITVEGARLDYFPEIS